MRFTDYLIIRYLALLFGPAYSDRHLPEPVFDLILLKLVELFPLGLLLLLPCTLLKHLEESVDLVFPQLVLLL